MAAKKKKGGAGSKASNKSTKGGAGSKASTGDAASKKLKGLASDWNTAAENPLADFGGWEDGNYRAKVVKAHLNESQNGRLQVTLEFEDVEGEAEGSQYKHCGLDVDNNPECLQYLQKDLRVMGYDCPNLNKLEGVLEEICADKPLVAIQVKTKNDFKNTYINNLIED